MDPPRSLTSRLRALFRGSPKLRRERARYFQHCGEARSFDAWIDQFAGPDRNLALDLVARLRYLSLPELRNYLCGLHKELASRVMADGLSLDRLDYTRPYRAKSGDLVSYLYRTTNRVPSVRFFDAEHLPAAKPGRGLVVLDDYLGSGAQFLTEFYGRGRAREFNQYERIYLLVVAAHPCAQERFRQVAQGRGAAVAEGIIGDYRLMPPEDQRTREAIRRVDPAKLRLIHAITDEPFTFRPVEQTFLKASVSYERNEGAPFGAAGLAGSTVFFYGPPNTIPDIFWNPLGRRGAAPVRPLFSRTEDISHYEFARTLPESEWIWGGP